MSVTLVTAVMVIMVTGTMVVLVAMEIWAWLLHVAAAGVLVDLKDNSGAEMHKVVDRDASLQLQTVGSEYFPRCQALQRHTVNQILRKLIMLMSSY